MNRLMSQSSQLPEKFICRDPTETGAVQCGAAGEGLQVSALTNEGGLRSAGNRLCLWLLAPFTDADTSCTEGLRFVLDTATVIIPDVCTSAMDTEPW